MPERNQKKPSDPYETPEQDTAESKPHDPFEAKPDGIPQAVGDSAKVAKGVDGGGIPAGKAEGASETGTMSEAEPVPIVPSGQQVEPKPTIEEQPPARSGPTVDEGNAAVLSDSRRHTRRSFMVAAAAATAGYGVYHWLDHLPADEMQQVGYRKAFEANAAISRAAFDDRVWRRSTLSRKRKISGLMVSTGSSKCSNPQVIGFNWSVPWHRSPTHGTARM